jgi:hypothetical protein
MPMPQPGTLHRQKPGQKAKTRPEYRRMSIDVALVVGLGRFFGAKFRSGVLYAIFEQSGDRTALVESLKYYKKARGFWAELANRAKDVYKPDITIGENPVIRGHWLDRLPAIDEDIAFMANILEKTKTSTVSQKENVRLAIQEAMGRPARLSAVCHHLQPQRLIPGQPLTIEISFDKAPASAHLYYRHVDQAERFETIQMQLQGNAYQAIIPAAYTDSVYPVQYYFELRQEPDKAWPYPGFKEDLANQPYFVVRKT